MARTLRSLLFEKYQRLPVAYFTRVTTGEISNRLLRDSGTIAACLNYVILPVIGAIVSVSLAAVGMVVLNRPLTWIFLVLTTCWVLSSIILAKRQLALQRETLLTSDVYAAFLSELLTFRSILRTRLAAGVKKLIKHHDDLQHAALTPVAKGAMLDGIGEALGQIIIGLGTFITLSIGLVQLREHDATIGSLTAFIGVYARLFQPIALVMHMRTQFPQFLACLERVRNVLNEREEPSGRLPLSDDYTIGFEDVTFSHDGNDLGVRDLTFTISGGQKIALVGPNGSGKSTIAQLIAGLLTPARGRILLGGVDLCDLSRESLRTNIFYLPQDAVLNSGTIRENLAFRAQYSDEALWHALNKVGLSEFVVSLPHRLGASLGLEATTISGGQRQLLALAPVFLERPKLCILDEALNSIAPDVRKSVLDELVVHLNGATLIVIAHDDIQPGLFDSILYICRGSLSSVTCNGQST